MVIREVKEVKTKIFDNGKIKIYELTTQKSTK
jgi:hypothetical protein